VKPARLALVALLAAVLSGCHGPVASGSPAAVPASSSPAPPPSPSPSLSPSASPPAYVASARPATAADVPHTWHTGCPVGPDRLSVLTLGYWGFDDQPHVGTMVVNTAVAGEVERIFGALFRERFPIRRMRPEDGYGGSDPASMADDNTSSFNCRYAVATGPPHWSVHAYGEAIDVNTVENPYLEGGRVLPPAGKGYVDRSRYRRGMAVAGGMLVRAFASVGWLWGGRWSGSPDWQHFSKTGG
jgi:hypothetical protein